MEQREPWTLPASSENQVMQGGAILETLGRQHRIVAGGILRDVIDRIVPNQAVPRKNGGCTFFRGDASAAIILPGDAAIRRCRTRFSPENGLRLAERCEDGSAVLTPTAIDRRRTDDAAATR
jgi:hypothetical protein